MADETKTDAQTDAQMTTASRSCGMSLDEHAELIMSALTIFGLGIGCETEYQALLCIAESAKILHGHAEYDPKPIAQKWADAAKVEIERRRAEEQTATVHDPVFPAPDNGIVH